MNRRKKFQKFKKLLRSKGITSLATPKVKSGTPTPSKPKTLPGVGANWVNPVPGLDLEDVRKAVDSNNWGLTMGKEALCNAIDNWFATFSDKQTIMYMFQSFNDQSYEWFKTSMKVTMGDIVDLKNMIMDTDAIDYLDWFDNGGGEDLATELNKSFGYSDPSECYDYVESISNMILSILNR